MFDGAKVLLLRCSDIALNGKGDATQKFTMVT